jgi:hypothetical protein
MCTCSYAAGQYDDTGASLYTFSGNRQSPVDGVLGDLDVQLQIIQSLVDAELPTTIRLTCSSDTFGYSRLLRSDLQGMASSPVRVLDEMLPAAASLSSLVSGVRGVAAPTHLAVHPGPLPSAQWTRLSSTASIAQVCL